MSGLCKDSITLRSFKGTSFITFSIKSIKVVAFYITYLSIVRFSPSLFMWPITKLLDHKHFTLLLYPRFVSTQSNKKFNQVFDSHHKNFNISSPNIIDGINKIIWAVINFSLRFFCASIYNSNWVSEYCHSSPEARLCRVVEYIVLFVSDL